MSKHFNSALEKKLMEAWDQEIEAEEKDDRALLKRSLADDLARREQLRKATQKHRAEILRVAGLTVPQALKLAEDDFAFSRKSAADRRKRAAAVLSKRLAARAKETKRMLTNLGRTK
jgi:hypothetical protein